MANFLTQGARPIDGELGIDAEGKVNGLLRAGSEASTGVRVSIAIAIGSYGSEAEEDAAIANRTNGSRGFKVISRPDAQSTTDLSAPWEPGSALPLCDRATLVVRSLDLTTSTTTITRNKMQLGMTTVLQAKLRLPDMQRNDPQPTFAAENPLLIPRSRSLPIDALVGMDARATLTGYVSVKDSTARIWVGFAPGRGHSLSSALQSITSKSDGYIPFTDVAAKVNLGSLARQNTTPDGSLNTPGGMIVIKEETVPGRLFSYTFLEVIAGGPSRWIPAKDPVILLPDAPSIGESGSDSRGLRSRSLPIDGLVKLDDTTGVLTGSLVIGGPGDVRSGAETWSVATVGIDTSQDGDNLNSVLKYIRRDYDDEAKAFTTIVYGTKLNIVDREALKGEIRAKRGKRVSLLIRQQVGKLTTYFLVEISGKGGRLPALLEPR